MNVFNFSMSDWSSALISWLKLSECIDPIVSSFRDFSDFTPFQDAFPFFFPESELINANQKIPTMISWLNQHIKTEYSQLPILKPVNIQELQNCNYSELENFTLKMFFAKCSNEDENNHLLDQLDSYDKDQLLRLLSQTSTSTSINYKELVQQISQYSQMYDSAKQFPKQLSSIKQEQAKIIENYEIELQKLEQSKTKEINDKKEEISKIQNLNLELMEEIHKLESQRSLKTTLNHEELQSKEIQLRQEIEEFDKQLEILKTKRNEINILKLKKIEKDQRIQSINKTLQSIQSEILTYEEIYIKEQKLSNIKETITQIDQQMLIKKAALQKERESGESAHLYQKLSDIIQKKKLLLKTLQNQVDSITIIQNKLQQVYSAV